MKDYEKALELLEIGKSIEELMEEEGEERCLILGGEQLKQRPTKN